MKLSRRRFLALGASLPVVAAVGSGIAAEVFAGQSLEALLAEKMAYCSRTFADALAQELWSEGTDCCPPGDGLRALIPDDIDEDPALSEYEWRQVSASFWLDKRV